MSQRKHKIIRKKKSQYKQTEEDSKAVSYTCTDNNLESFKQPKKECMEEIVEQDMSEYKTIKPLLMPIKQVGLLEPQLRLKLKQEHSHLAEYIFMTQRQKSKYFHQKNLKYNSVMQTPGSLPARKISFKRNFQVKSFIKQEAPKVVKTAKSFRDKYNQKIHYS